MADKPKQEGPRPNPRVNSATVLEALRETNRATNERLVAIEATQTAQGELLEAVAEGVTLQGQLLHGVNDQLDRLLQLTRSVSLPKFIVAAVLSTIGALIFTAPIFKDNAGLGTFLLLDIVIFAVFMAIFLTPWEFRISRRQQEQATPPAAVVAEEPTAPVPEVGPEGTSPNNS